MPTPARTYFGLDLTFPGRGPATWAVLDDGPGVVAVGSSFSDQEIMEQVKGFSPVVVGIDAPLTLPFGLDCLEESCPCQAASSLKGRQCERGLARLGIGCYFTTKRSIIKPLVYRGMGLKKVLEGQGYCVIEVYPHASKVRLFGHRMPRKKANRASRTVLQGLLGSLISGLAPYAQSRILGHDELDSLLAAHTAWLYGHGGAEAVGEPEEGLIYLPV